MSYVSPTERGLPLVIALFDLYALVICLTDHAPAIVIGIWVAMIIKDVVIISEIHKRLKASNHE